VFIGGTPASPLCKTCELRPGRAGAGGGGRGWVGGGVLPLAPPCAAGSHLRAPPDWQPHPAPRLQLAVSGSWEVGISNASHHSASATRPPPNHHHGQQLTAHISLGANWGGLVGGRGYRKGQLRVLAGSPPPPPPTAELLHMSSEHRGHRGAGGPRTRFCF
jgi:hypothetical protein